MNTTNSSSESAGAHQRLYFLDWLRILAFALLVVYHVGMYYVTWGWHVKSPAASTAIEPLMLLSSPWRMGLLFLISGAALMHALAAKPRPAGAFFRRRSGRLLWPLLFGMLLIVPPQSYFEVIAKFGYSGSYLDFMPDYLRGNADFCRLEEGRRRCLSLPTWNHLWFLPYLWAYTGLALMLARWAPRLLAWGSGAIAARSGSTLLLMLLGALPLMAARLTLVQFEVTHNLVWDWYAHAQYLGLFLLGYLMAGAGDKLWLGLHRLRWLALAAALCSWAGLMLYFKAYADTPPPDTLRYAMRLLWGGMQWWALVAVCGFARQWLNRDNPLRRALAPAIFCVYILHQPVIIVLTRLLLPLALTPLLEGTLLTGLTFAICAAGYLGLRRIPILRSAMGIERPRT
ncbi:acyltransferase family protein [Paucibacter sp. AS339]|uniref:acyltransferase family protein n=1 Tax=Paucibacter hankyongi TaxID=3133434 RepID=UPI00309D6ACD